MKRNRAIFVSICIRQTMVETGSMKLHRSEEHSIYVIPNYTDCVVLQMPINQTQSHTIRIELTVFPYLEEKRHVLNLLCIHVYIRFYRIIYDQFCYLLLFFHLSRSCIMVIFPKLLRFAKNNIVLGALLCYLLYYIVNVRNKQ